MKGEQTMWKIMTLKDVCRLPDTKYWRVRYLHESGQLPSWMAGGLPGLARRGPRAVASGDWYDCTQ